MIYVCSVLDLETQAATLRPDRVISIIAPEEQPPTPRGLDAANHLRVACHDIVAAAPMEILPDRGHVKQLIDFARQWRPPQPVLVHCQAGISRSTAAALIVYASHFPETIEDAAAHLRRTGPHVRPNTLITSIGDEILGMNGRLLAAVEAMGTPSMYPGTGIISIPHPDPYEE